MAHLLVSPTLDPIIAYLVHCEKDDLGCHARLDAMPTF